MTRPRAAPRRSPTRRRFSWARSAQVGCVSRATTRMITVLDRLDENGYRYDLMRLAATIGVAVIAAFAAGCDSSSNGGRTVVAAFYPLAYAAEAVAGAGTSVRN